MFSLSDMVRMAVIVHARTQHEPDRCLDWELVLHAFFDAELNAADSLACELHLGRCQRCSGEMKDLKSMRQKLRRSAIGWDAPDALRSRIGQYRLSKRRSLQVLAEKRASNGLPLGGRRERLGNRGKGDRLLPSRTEQKSSKSAM